ncbi:MAG: site-2 protease family protein [Candidatus Heimdallarchaeota archaeon]|nr:site-2 protease family protein [Candidatus Heimdallarchaeota archaeon]
MHWIFSFLILASIWFLIYILGRYFKLDERYGWTLGPLFLLIRTKRFNKFIERLAKKHARFWILFGNVSIVFGFLSMLASFAALLYSLTITLLPNSPVEGAPTVGIIIPGVTISFKTTLYLIIPIILTMIPHELAHGVVSHADGVELKSTGLAFFAIFFGAFVEPEEESLKKSSYWTRMRTFASGMFPNLLVGLLTLPLLFYAPAILNPFYAPVDGVLIQEVIPNTPAANAGLERGMVLYSLNNTHLYNVTTFTILMNATQPNQLIVLNTTKGTIDVRLGVHPDDDSRGYLGVYTLNYRAPKTRLAWKFFPNYFQQQLLWIVVVTFGSVLFNALPIPFLLDGDKLLAPFLFTIFKREKTALIILDIFRFLALALFLAVLIIPIIKFGFIPIR